METIQPPTQPTPELDVGLNVVDVPAHRSPALHQLALQQATADGDVIWIDARNNAISQLLRHPGSRRRFASIRLARAFTAYQHYELVRSLPGEIEADTPLIVTPCLASLYRDDDVPPPEDEQYLQSTVAILAETAETFDIPILASSARTDGLRAIIEDYETKTISVEVTSQGHRFESDDFQTTVYWSEGFWQTTIPYWVDLFGAVEETRSVEQAIDEGLVPTTV